MLFWKMYVTNGIQFLREFWEKACTCVELLLNFDLNIEFILERNVERERPTIAIFEVNE